MFVPVATGDRIEILKRPVIVYVFSSVQYPNFMTTDLIELNFHRNLYLAVVMKVDEKNTEMKRYERKTFLLGMVLLEARWKRTNRTPH